MQTLQLNTRLSNKSWVSASVRRALRAHACTAGRRALGRGRPVCRGLRRARARRRVLTCAQIDEGFAEDDLESNLQRDKYARLCGTVNQLIDELTPSAPDFQLRDACDQLVRPPSCASTWISRGAAAECYDGHARDAGAAGVVARHACDS